MCVEDALGEGTGFEQREAEQHRISHASPDRIADVAADGDVLHQHGIDGDTDDDKERLKAECKQTAQIILPRLPPFAVHHGRHRNGRDGGHEVNLDHASIHDDEDADGKRPHGNPDEQALKPQSEQRSKLHLCKACFQIGNNAADIDGRIGNDNTACAVHDALRRVKNPHDDVPSVRHDENGSRRLERPFEKHPCINVR